MLGGAAIGLGIQSRKRIVASQGQVTGEGIAKAAVVLGLLDVAFTIFLIARL